MGSDLQSSDSPIATASDVISMAEASVSGLHALRQINTDSEDTLCVSCLSDGRIISGHESAFKVWSSISDGGFRDGNSLLHTVALPLAGDVTCICQSPRHQQQLAVSVSSSVVCYDLQNLSTPVQVYSYNSDEINQICFHHSGPYVCACDDSGDVKIINTDTSTLFKTLSGRHSNLCMSAKFLPRKPWEVVSGGMDCKVVRWDFSRPRPIVELSTQSASEEVQSENMLVNPPMVHSIDTWTSNHCIACGLGNGIVAVYELRGKEITLKCKSTAHSAMVVCVRCFEQVENGEKCYYIVSGANDCKVVLLRMTDKEESATYQKTAHGLGHLQPVTEIQHSSKINWICTDSMVNVYVADQTPFVSIYKLFS